MCPEQQSAQQQSVPWGCGVCLQEVYGMMVAAGVPPNQFTFGILLEAVGHGGRLKAALQVFNEMKAAGIPPSTSTFNFLIEACATAPQPDVSGPSQPQITPLILVLLRGGHDWWVCMPHQNQKGSPCAPHLPEPQALNPKPLCCPLSVLQSERAWALFEEMDALPGVRVNAESLNNLITACCKVRPAYTLQVLQGLPAVCPLP